MSPSGVEQEITIRVPGGTLRGVCRGTGPAVVLLHGGPGCYDYLAGSVLADWLAEAHTVCSYDQRGCRNSSSEGPFTIEANVADLEAVRLQLHADRITILGHSAGAFLALFYAVAHPTRVDRLILLSPAGLKGDWRPDFDATIRNRLTAAQQARLDEIDRRIAQTTDEDAREELYRRRFDLALPCYVDPAHRAVAPRMPHYSREVNVRMTASLNDASVNPSFRAALRRFDRPCGIIHGRSDPIPWRVVDDYVRTLTNTSVFPLDRCGHFPWLEGPEPCRAALVAFLESSR